VARVAVLLLAVLLFLPQSADADSYLNALIRSDGFTRDYADYLHCRTRGEPAACEAHHRAMLRRLITDGADADRARALVASLVAAAEDMDVPASGGNDR
jgi:hypothetical protein